MRPKRQTIVACDICGALIQSEEYLNNFNRCNKCLEKHMEKRYKVYLIGELCKPIDYQIHHGSYTYKEFVKKYKQGEIK